MSYAYSRSTRSSSLPSFTPRPSSTYHNILDNARDLIPPAAKQWMAEGRAPWRTGRPQSRDDIKTSVRRTVKGLFTVVNALIILWIFTLWRGERTVFEESLAACTWDNWERWPQDATPHHVAFISDPQLVDPHTYPGRPWPLSTLTVKYTDQYLRRSFSLIQERLLPDSVLFLGDLFDGGREWATATSSSPEERYKGIKDSFWKKEYGRFRKIFTDQLDKGASPPLDGRGRRMMASLPGNHDLGFGTGIQEPVRTRFETYFGESNRVDVIGNHTFVSVDTVSLSAMDQPDPKTGGSGTIEGDPAEMHRPIWKDADEFLDQAASHKAKAETRELRMLNGQDEGFRFDHRVVDAKEPSIRETPQVAGIGLPTILLTHVPLYRRPATPCGPLRERYPQSSPSLEEDEPNALKIQGGYQYQNVLTSTISNELVSKAGPNIVQVYSGDDHDYCEISHREFNGSPKEITVKSLSWAMGVRKPGFVLTSLWNPIDPETGKALRDGSPTIQNHLCLLPDQLSIFIHYGCILGLTLLILFLHSVYRVTYAAIPPPSSNDSVLPLSERRTYPPQYHSSGTSSSTLPSPGGGLASRGGPTAGARYPGKPTYSDAYYPALDRDDAGYSAGAKEKVPFRPSSSKLGIRPAAILIGRELLRSVRRVARVVLVVYFFLLWRW
ncbi:hypothetical protein N7474_004433 [Penicillium riverlandense]|uniref:uncharacterized protein n=1 Tax=Penicillium riverlandense TaxID=1903569 RepID=UPI002547492B|nr:uncharacterized protein N7474_004433 [Penicillium riverlandense]KAJ5818842.1 hypothetical protein N7474_004433 [Penicillium riverlandense]